jgi:hypothetical protein
MLTRLLHTRATDTLFTSPRNFSAGQRYPPPIKMATVSMQSTPLCTIKTSPRGLLIPKEEGDLARKRTCLLQTLTRSSSCRVRHGAPSRAFLSAALLSMSKLRSGIFGSPAYTSSSGLTLSAIHGLKMSQKVTKAPQGVKTSRSAVDGLDG